MSAKQRSYLNVLILLNVLVYSVFGLYALVIKPAQERNDAVAAVAVVVQPTERLAAPTLASQQAAPTAVPTDSPVPSPSPSPTGTATPTAIPQPTSTPLPWEQGGSWWAPTSSSPEASGAITATTAAVALAPTATPTPTNTPLPWEPGGSWWAPPSSPTLALAPTRIAAALPSPAAQHAAQQISSASSAIGMAMPSGDSPSSAITPADNWRLLDSGGAVWYRVGKGGEHMDVFLDASTFQGVTMQIYAPGILDHPIGQGSQEKGRLVWSGGAVNTMGDWLARVANGNAAAVNYKLSVLSREIARCSTHSYWEWIGQSLVWWTACQ